MTTWLIWRLREWPNDYKAKVGTTRMAQIATWPRWGLPEWPRWLHGQGGDFQSGLDNYMAKVGLPVAQMPTWPILGLPEWPRWLHSQDGDYQNGPDDYLDMMGTT